MTTIASTVTSFLVTTSTITNSDTSNFAGYQLAGGSVFPYYCAAAGYTYTTTSTLAGCCTSGDYQCLSLKSGCYGGSTIYDATAASICTSSQVCCTDYHYDQYPINGNPVKLTFFCGDEGDGASFYQKVISAYTTGTSLSTFISVIPAATPSSISPSTQTVLSTTSTPQSSSTSSSLPTTSSIPPTSSIPTTFSLPTTSTTFDDPTSSSSVTQTSTNFLQTTSMSSASSYSEAGSSQSSSTTVASGGAGSPSQAWIAGAVIGSLVAVALLAGLIWYLVRRRARQVEAGGTIEKSGMLANGNGYAPVMSPSMLNVDANASGRTTMIS